TSANAFAASMSPQISGPMATCAPSGTVLCSGLPNGETSDLAFLGEIANGGSQLLYLALLGANNTTLPPGSSNNGLTGASSVAVDSSGNAYLTGATTSSFFPVTSDAYQTTQLTPCDSQTGCGGEAFLSILNPAVSGNSSLVYSTYLGASPEGSGQSNDEGFGVALDPTGNIYLDGDVAMNSAFPTTQGAFQTSAPYGGGFTMKFSATAAGSAAAISAVSGGGQSATIGAAFANPLVVNVTDASNHPVSGATVTFTAPASGASASFSSTTATTDSSGNASVTATANGIAAAAAYQVSAAVAGVSTPATFSLTNTQAATILTVTPTSLSLVYGQMVT
ncbi:MAG: SBBP repeat-containing protein, partial [Gemmataceae bacterium]